MDLDVDNGANVAAVATEGTSELEPPSMGQFVIILLMFKHCFSLYQIKWIFVQTLKNGFYFE